MENQTDEAIVEIVELEEYAKELHGPEVPRAKHYAFRVDKTRIVVDTPTITGAQILDKAGKNPDQFKLYQHKRGNQPIPVGPHDTVNLRERGVERFTTMPSRLLKKSHFMYSNKVFRVVSCREIILEDSRP